MGSSFSGPSKKDAATDVDFSTEPLSSAASERHLPQSIQTCALCQRDDYLTLSNGSGLHNDSHNHSSCSSYNHNSNHNHSSSGASYHSGSYNRSLNGKLRVAHNGNSSSGGVGGAACDKETTVSDIKRSLLELDACAHDVTPSSSRGTPTPRVYRRRWLMVFLFASYSLSNAYQWIHLNIIANVVQRHYNASLPSGVYARQLAIDWLSMVYMLAYVPLVFVANWVLERRGLRQAALLGTLLNAVGAWLKCGAAAPGRFALLMTAQTVCAVAQVFILGVPARLAAVWFGPDQVSTATAIGVFGNQLGCALGFVVPPLIVPNLPEVSAIGQRLSYMFYGGAGMTTLLFILVIIVFRDAPPVPPSQAQAVLKIDNKKCAAHEETGSDKDRSGNYGDSLMKLFKHRGFVLLTFTYGINTGSYYAIGTLLNSIILYYFQGGEKDAGMVGLTIVIAGVFGSIISGLWLDKTKLFKSTTAFIYFMSFAGMMVFTFTLNQNLIWLPYLCGGLLGFFMTGYLPIGFEFAAEITYPTSEGTSSGLLNASAQIMGIIFTTGMGALINSFGVFSANIAISSALGIGTILTCFIKSDLRRQKAGQMVLTHERKIYLNEKHAKTEESVIN